MKHPLTAITPRHASRIFKPPIFGIFTPLTVYERGIFGRGGGCRGGREHGWARAMDGQPVHRTAVAERKTGRHLCAGLRGWTDGTTWIGEVVWGLQYGAPASGPGVCDARWSKGWGPHQFEDFIDSVGVSMSVSPASPILSMQAGQRPASTPVASGVPHTEHFSS